MEHWNLGSANLENKLNEIEVAIKNVKPAVLGISEANLRHTVDLATVQLPGYSLLTSKTPGGF